MKRKLSILLAFCMMFFVFAACSSETEEKPAEEVEVTEEENNEVEEEVTTANLEDLDFDGRTLNVVTTSDKYTVLFDEFAELVNAKVEFLDMSSGEVLARVEAEGGKPMADLWFGGGIDAFMSAKEKGLLAEIDPAEKDQIDERFVDPDGYWIAKGLTVVGFIVDPDRLEEMGVEVPRTWEDLLDPAYEGEIIMSTPAVSGTMYGAVKGLIDHMGEEEAWDYFENLNKNIPFYGKRGKDPQEKVNSGEFAIGILPADKLAKDEAEDNGNIVLYPEDAIPWVPEGVAVFDGGEGVDIARAFIDFMLQDDIQAKIAELDGKDSNQMIKENVKGFDLGLDPSKFIDEDIESFGTMRDEVIEKFDEISQGK